jgi:hypothetical protein
MRKRSLGFILALVMVLSAISFATSAAGSENHSDFSETIPAFANYEDHEIYESEYLEEEQVDDFDVENIFDEYEFNEEELEELLEILDQIQESQEKAEIYCVELLSEEELEDVIARIANGENILLLCNPAHI